MKWEKWNEKNEMRKMKWEKWNEKNEMRKMKWEKWNEKSLAKWNEKSLTTKWEITLVSFKNESSTVASASNKKGHCINEMGNHSRLIYEWAMSFMQHFGTPKTPQDTAKRRKLGKGSLVRLWFFQNESWHKYAWIEAQVWMSHVAHVSEWWHTYEWVLSHKTYSNILGGYDE